MSKFDHALVVKITTMGVAAITIGAAVWGFFSKTGDSVVGAILNCINLV